jgi:TolB-like protein
LNSQPLTAETAAQIRAQLSAVLASPQFRQGLQKQGAFLQYVVERALEGDTAALNEAAVGAALFGTESSQLFGETVPMVARRARAGLRSYYSAGGRRAPLRIELPSGSYIPVFGKPMSAVGRYALRSVAAAALLLALVGTVWEVRRMLAPRLAFNSIAIARFINLGGLPATEAAGDVMAASVASDLHRYKELQVIAPQRGADAQSIRTDLPKPAAQPPADVLLRGAVYPMDGGVGFLAQLVDGRSGRILWSQNYAVAEQQATAVAADISYAVARAAGVTRDR